MKVAEKFLNGIYYACKKRINQAKRKVIQKTDIKQPTQGWAPLSKISFEVSRFFEIGSDLLWGKIVQVIEKSFCTFDRDWRSRTCKTFWQLEHFFSIFERSEQFLVCHYSDLRRLMDGANKKYSLNKLKILDVKNMKKVLRFFFHNS